MVERKKRSARLQRATPDLMKALAPPSIPPATLPLPASDRQQDIKAKRHPEQRPKSAKPVGDYAVKYRVHLTPELRQRIAAYAETSRLPQKDVIRSCIKRSNQLMRDLYAKGEISTLTIPDPNFAPLPKEQQVSGRIIVPHDLYTAISARFDPLELHSKVRLMTLTYVALFNHLFKIS